MMIIGTPHQDTDLLFLFRTRLLRREQLDSLREAVNGRETAWPAEVIISMLALLPPEES